MSIIAIRYRFGLLSNSYDGAVMRRRRLFCIILITPALLYGMNTPGVGSLAFFDDFGLGLRWSELPGIELNIGQHGDDPCCLHIRGGQPKAWNYARSGAFALKGGTKYRLSARIWVESVSPAVSPYLKLEFMTAVERREQRE